VKTHLLTRTVDIAYYLPMRSLLRSAVAVALLLSGRAVAQVPPKLGPVDGADLPPIDTGRVAVGTVAPDFTLESKDGGTVTLSQFRGKKTVVLVFYRGHW
jgi:cytochrome oxidase Cu insertion factor (SCO1/SenC/PrrC family)